MKATSWVDRLVIDETLGKRLGPFAVLIGLATLFAFGLFGVARTNIRFEDFYYFYANGVSWLRGIDLYDSETYVRLWGELFGTVPSIPISAYPPQAAPLWMAFAAIDFRYALIAWGAFNLFCLALLARLLVLYVQRADVELPARDFADNKWLLPALLLCMPTTWTAIWLGQPVPLAVLLLMGSWMCARQRNDVLAGALLGLATFKPQFMLLVALWFLLDRRWKLLAVAAIVSLLAALYGLIRIGPVHAIEGWLQVISTYESYEANGVGDVNVLGVASILYSIGLPVTGLELWLPVACVLVIALYIARRRFLRDDVLGIIMAIQLSFVYGHVYEMLLLLPMIASLWLHLRDRPAFWLFCLTVALTVIPERVMEGFGSDALMHWRSWIVLLGLACLAILSLRETSAREARQPGNERERLTSRASHP